MKMHLAILFAGALVQQASAPPPARVTSAHSLATPATQIEVPEISAYSTFSALLAIGSQNHIPMGLVVGDSSDTRLCKVGLSLKQSAVDLGDLISAIKVAVPDYEVDLQGGVLDVFPMNLPPGTAQFLDLGLAEFHHAPDSYTGQGFALWRSVYAVIAPDAGSNFVYFSSPETAPQIDVSNQSVKTILNMIVNQGSRGVWILRSSKIKQLSRDTEMPFEINGYVGQGAKFASNASCFR